MYSIWHKSRNISCSKVFKTGIVTIIYTSGSKSDVNNYHPISLVLKLTKFIKFQNLFLLKIFGQHKIFDVRQLYFLREIIQHKNRLQLKIIDHVYYTSYKCNFKYLITRPEKSIFNHNYHHLGQKSNNIILMELKQINSTLCKTC